MASYEAYVCPEGYYCPAGSTSGTANACPSGTYGPRMGLDAASGCVNCPRGKFCASSATVPGGWATCGTGNYCPEGSGAELPCPSGTFSNATNLGAAEECFACPAGSFCAGGGVAVSGACAAGH